jgi:hypothetical protein
LCVEPPRLEDATDAWKVESRASSWILGDKGVRWGETLDLVQVKPGPLPLPGVKVRFRENPTASWKDAEWLDILKHSRDVVPPEIEPAAPSRRHLWFAGLVAAGIALLLLLGGFLLRRRRRAQPDLQSPQARALQELLQLEQTTLPPLGDAREYFTLLSSLIRRYLADRFDFPAPRQTTAEFLRAAKQTEGLSPDHFDLLRDFCQRCDLAKFAQTVPTSEECQKATDIGRTIVEQTLLVAPQPNDERVGATWR